MRITELDGLRGISILLVLLSHAWMGKYVPGGFGVTTFFFISGYIITRLMLAEYEGLSSFSLKAFYARRVFRLMPALLVYTAICAIVLLCGNVSLGWMEIAATILFFSNYLSIYGDHAVIGYYSPLSIAWSLAIEEHFYLMWPVAFVFFRGRRQVLFKLVIFLVVAALAWRCYLVFGVGLDHLPHYRLYKASDTRFDSILYGVLFALLANSRTFIEFVSKNMTFLIGVGLLVCSLLIRSNEFRESFRYSVQGLGLLFVCWRLMHPISFAARALRSDSLQFLGKISYSLYLYHWLVFVVVQYYLGHQPVFIKAAVMLPSSVFLAWASYHFVEQPGLRYGRAYISPGKI